MIVERTNTELVVRLPLTTELKKLNDFLQYLKVMAILSRATGTEEGALKLAEEVDTENWKKRNYEVGN